MSTTRTTDQVRRDLNFLDTCIVMDAQALVEAKLAYESRSTVLAQRLARRAVLVEELGEAHEREADVVVSNMRDECMAGLPSPFNFEPR